MISWAFMLFCVSREIYASSEVHYECGPHGKFEYCIDGIPGCVVGCHCYPGYYFDTDTKICEPNMKLTQFRRRYDLEPTRVTVMDIPPASVPTLTSVNPIEEKVDAIAKDTDDLGDWLYNQFFKTVENQVINNTDREVLTRRSGSHSIKPKRRSRKKNKRYKKKHKKKGLKSKLLRITEDDSLFDSSSSSSSDDTDSSSSDSESDSSDDHDHRKILMINKKPTPPLPSFIFLPNVETPFFPPISLPAPPIVPMYPMVPVPPMGIIYPGASPSPSSPETSIPPSSATASGAPDSTTVSAAVSNGKTTTTVATTMTSEMTETTAPEETTRGDSARAGLRSQYDEILSNNGNKNMHRNKFLQKIRDKMKKRNKRPPINNFMENFQDAETQYANEPEQSYELRQKTFNDMPKLEDVDFKYLSQLIHKIDINKTMPQAQYNPLASLSISDAMPLRRSNYQNNVPQKYINPAHKPRPISKADEINDSYYTDLGKQIAALIRKLDSNGEREVNIEIQQSSQNPVQTIFDENRYAPRSYWERFVRSPLKYFQSFLLGHKRSNENLINIENQVNMATTIERSLSLRELENIANIMQNKLTKIEKRKNKQSHPSLVTLNGGISKANNNLNVNLLPSAVRSNGPKELRINKNRDVKNIKIATEKSTNKLNSYSFIRRRGLPKDYKYNYNNLLRQNQTKSFRDIKIMNPLNNNLKTRPKTSLYRHGSDITNKNVTNGKPLTAERMYQLNPILLNYKSIKYLTNNRNKYHVQRSYIPFHVPYFSKQKPTRNSGKPSYFDHELHHFDYFD